MTWLDGSGQQHAGCYGVTAEGCELIGEHRSGFLDWWVACCFGPWQVAQVWVTPEFRNVIILGHGTQALWSWGQQPGSCLLRICAADGHG